MGPAFVLSTLVVALLSLAETSIPLLLRPPGEDSFPIATLTIMANAPERQVAAMGFVYVVAALTILSIGFALSRKQAIR
jgi:ABC-type spermidine/putrescine transport system permease subunit II